MNPVRSLLLAASQSRRLREQASRRRFVRRAVSRFMPGEALEDALGAAASLREKGIGAVLTRLGENVEEEAEADAVREHYLGLLERAGGEGGCEISVKPTQLGLDLDEPSCFERLRALVERAHALGGFVWIDMEQSRYVEATLRMYERLRGLRPEVGVCVQAYLRRTARDLASLMALGGRVRLVKGAYREPPQAAFPRRAEVDASYLELARALLEEQARGGRLRVVFGTHDMGLGERIRAHAAGLGLPAAACEFHLLYGIHRAEQERLAREGVPVRVLISYGSYWFPWYMRRLAERPANVLFLVRSLFTR